MVKKEWMREKMGDGRWRLVLISILTHVALDQHFDKPDD
jgi:hypothetical protein